MPVWKIEPKEQNKVAELQFWTKDSTMLTRKELFAYSSFQSDSVEIPLIDLTNDNGIEITAGTNYNWNIDRLDSRAGGPWVTWIFPDSTTQEEKNRISDLIDIGMYTALEQDGWVFSKTEYWLYGPLQITEVR
jgi:hypothetical protein